MPRLLHYSDIENVFDTPERAARLAGRISELDGPDALVVGTGDTIAPGVLSTVARGRQAVDFYAATDTALETFGNHEFDYGPDELRGIVEEAPVQWVSANVFDENDDPFGRDEGVVSHTIRDVDGADVGFLGVTDPTTDSLNPMADGLGFGDPVTAAEESVSALRDEGVDHVVVLSHLGAGDDELAELDVDAVLGGHVHSTRHEYVDGTLLVRPSVNGKRIIEVDLDGDGAATAVADDGTSTVVDDDGTSIDGDSNEAPTGAASDATPADGESLPTATFHYRDGAPVDESLKEALEQRLAQSGLDEIVGRVDDPIERTGDVVHSGECRVGNFVADAFQWVHDADLGLSNSGGLRAGDPLAGDVTKADMISLLPFEEPVVLVEVTGTELLTVLREMAAPDIDFGEDDWWHGHVSGAEVVWDPAAEQLAHVRVDGEPVAPNATYTVATSEYLLHSDHEFPTLEEHHRAGEASIQHEVLCDYAREMGIAPEIEERIRLVEGAVDEADETATSADTTSSSGTDSVADAE